MVLRSQGLFKAGETDTPHAVLCVIDTLLWQVFADALNAHLQSNTQAKSTLAKINFTYDDRFIAEA